MLFRRSQWHVYWLLVASYAFYYSWDPVGLVILGYVTVSTYLLTYLSEAKSRKIFGIAVANPLLVLVCCKIFASTGFGFSEMQTLNRLSVSIGVSYFTLQAVSYAVDVQRGISKLETSFARFALFLAFFPRLLCGPIERGTTLLPQMSSAPPIDGASLSEGASLFIVGLFKKIALADYLAGYVDPVYAAPGNYGGPTLLLATIAYTWQLYFDFSGYTDMARGIARLFGYTLSENFRNPFSATNLYDFWNRWHISLTTWIRDYVYFPMARWKNKGIWNHVNVFIVMLLSGVWHGAGSGFVAWGALHGMGRCATMKIERSKWYTTKIPKALKQIWIFSFFSLALVLFRSGTITKALTIFVRMFEGPVNFPGIPVFLILVCAIPIAYHFLHQSFKDRLFSNRFARIGFVSAMLIYLITIPGTSGSGFIYLQF